MDNITDETAAVQTVSTSHKPLESLDTPTRGTGFTNVKTTTRVLKMSHAARVGRPHQVFPDNLPQQTFQEVRSSSVAICDGVSGRHWTNVIGEIALKHVIPDAPLQTKLTASPALDWFDKPASYEALRQELQGFSPATVLLFNLAIGIVLKKRHAEVEIDELIRELGWYVRNKTDRAEKRRIVYRWLLLLQSFTVHGRRVGKYHDKLTNEVIDLSVSSEIIRITEVYHAEQQLELDRSEPPIRLTLSASPWLERLADDPKVLQNFGRVQKLAGLPTGKASGAWALSIGLGLNQLWRERAARAEVCTVGEANKLTVNFGRPFTRLELLDLFQPSPSPEEILTSANPKRAVKYWDDAIKHLKDHGVIGHYRTLDAMPQSRRDWGEFWLKQQRLDLSLIHI